MVDEIVGQVRREPTESRRYDLARALTGLDIKPVRVKSAFWHRAKGFIGADEAPRLTRMCSQVEVEMHSQAPGHLVDSIVDL